MMKFDYWGGSWYSGGVNIIIGKWSIAEPSTTEYKDLSFRLIRRVI